MYPKKRNGPSKTVSLASIMWSYLYLPKRSARKYAVSLVMSYRFLRRILVGV